MLSHLKLIVSSTFIFMLVASLSAKQIPISEEVEITIPLGKFSVVEFPFKISSKNITSFMAVKTIKSSKKQDGTQAEKQNKILNKNVIPTTKQGAKPTIKKTKKYISITQNVNGFTFFTRREGTLKMVIWGYRHPILLTLKVSKENGYGLYQFILPQSESQEVFKTEQGSHESVVDKLMVHLFNQTLPKGYRTDSEDVVYKSKGFQMRLNREIRGRKYLGQEWILTKLINSNKKQSDSSSIIHEESFYQKGIYGVSLEADEIESGESIRVFIVRNLPMVKEKRYAR